MASTGSFKRFASRLLGLLLLVALVTVGVREGLHWYRHVYEPNASIEADITRLASSVNAKVQTIHVQRGQSVRRGELLASMEADVARLEVDSIAADLEKEKAVRAQVEAELAYFRTELDDRVATAREAVRLLDDERATLRERLAIARKNVERNSELLSRSMVARQRIDEANDKLLEVTGLLRDLETKLKTAERRLDELEGQRKQESIYQSRIAVIDRNIEKLRILLAQAAQQLEDMHIYSPIDGVVNELYVNPGTYVEDGDPVLLLHDPNQLWIEANIDESDIRHVKVGQDVVIDIDAYPYEHFVGRVRTIGHITLSMMRSEQGERERARAAQKIPVIIDLPKMDRVVWPGMRAAVNIVIR